MNKKNQYKQNLKKSKFNEKWACHYYGAPIILSWIRSVQTIEFLNVWEKKYNISYDGAQMSTVQKLIKERNLSIKQWVELTNSKGY